MVVSECIWKLFSYTLSWPVDHLASGCPKALSRISTRAVRAYGGAERGGRFSTCRRLQKVVRHVIPGGQGVGVQAKPSVSLAIEHDERFGFGWALTAALVAEEQADGHWAGRASPRHLRDARIMLSSLDRTGIDWCVTASPG